MIFPVYLNRFNLHLRNRDALSTMNHEPSLYMHNLHERHTLSAKKRFNNVFSFTPRRSKFSSLQDLQLQFCEHFLYRVYYMPRTFTALPLTKFYKQ